MNTALLIGINTYRFSQIQHLEGCIHDVEAMNRYLQPKWGQDNILIRTNEDATRSGILDAFQEVEKRIGPGDIALVYYSGHGTREPSPTDFSPYQEDDFHEAIVCHDSMDSAYDIADKELSVLISRLSAREAEVVMIFDCCHSGSITRGGPRLAARYDATSRAGRPLETFLPGTLGQLKEHGGKHVVLSACSPTEVSWESSIGPNGQQRGVFTLALLEVLQQPLGASLSYNSLLQATSLRVQQILGVGSQSPQVEATGRFDVNRSFLSEKRNTSGLNLYPIRPHLNQAWTLPLGAIHGITSGSISEVFRNKKALEKIGTARVETCDATTSLLTLTLEESAKDQPLYVHFDRLGGDPMPVYVTGSCQDQLALVLSELPEAEDEPHFNRSLVRNAFLWTRIPRSAEVGIHLTKAEIRMIYPDTKQDIIPGLRFPFKGLSDQVSAFKQILKGLLYIRSVWRLENLKGMLQPGEPPFDQVAIRFRAGEVDSSGSHITVDVDNRTDYRLEIINLGSEPVYCAALYVSRHYQIEQVKMIGVLPGEGYKILDENGFSFPQKGGSDLFQIPETFHLILSEENLPFLDVNQTIPLSEILRENYRYRAISTGYMPVEVMQKWTHKVIRIKLLKRTGSIGNTSLSIAQDRIRIEAHTDFKADVSISSFAQQFSPHLTDQILAEEVLDAGFVPVDFSDFGYLRSILEIHHIVNSDSLLQEPLHLSIQATTETEELWAFTLKESIVSSPQEIEESLYPMGKAQIKDGRFSFYLDHLPKNPRDGRIVSGSSIKILFAFKKFG